MKKQRPDFPKHVQFDNRAAFAVAMNIVSDLRLFLGACDAVQLHMQNPPLLHKASTGCVHVFVESSESWRAHDRHRND